MSFKWIYQNRQINKQFLKNIENYPLHEKAYYY